MVGDTLAFDNMRDTARRVIDSLDSQPLAVGAMFLVRDLYGTLRVIASEDLRDNDAVRRKLEVLTSSLEVALGAHAVQGSGVVFAAASMLDELRDQGQRLTGDCFWVDRLITGRGWWTVEPISARRFTLYSVKGGVGRSTTTAVLAWHLAQRGERVLVVDLDLESPGLATAVLEQWAHPRFGVTDWFVEDLVGQADLVAKEMTGTPSWASDLEGAVHIAPAHGYLPGEYLAKLGRVYTADDWPGRLRGLLACLESRCDSTITLIESRNGLHDVAAATVTDVGADVLLFGKDSESHWSAYDILFEHWQSQGLATSIRERLSMVSAMTPVNGKLDYLASFREKAWHLFRDRLYDDAEVDAMPDESFSFDLGDADAPHTPMPIHWTLGLDSIGSLHELDEANVLEAYKQFLSGFDSLLKTGEG